MLFATVSYKGKSSRLKLPGGCTVKQAMEKAGINPETVIVRRGREIIPETERVQGKDRLEAISVVSGG